MAVIEGTTRLKTVTADYDFATDGGAASTITLRNSDSLGNLIPSGAVITGGFIDVTSACLSATGTMALTAESAGDLVVAVGQASWTAGRKSIVPAGTGATAIKTTAARSLSITIATAAFTAGTFKVTVFYK
jgi:hypothetical protein